MFHTYFFEKMVITILMIFCILLTPDTVKNKKIKDSLELNPNLAKRIQSTNHSVNLSSEYLVCSHKYFSLFFNSLVRFNLALD